MYKINQGKAQMLRQDSKLWWLDAEMLNVVSGKDTDRPLSLLRAHAASITAHCTTSSECYFCFSPFVKVKIFFGFLSVSKNQTLMHLS